MCAVGKLEAYDHGRRCSRKLGVYRKCRTVGHIAACKKLLHERVGLGTFAIVYRVNVKFIDISGCGKKQRLYIRCGSIAEQSQIGCLAVGSKYDVDITFTAVTVTVGDKICVYNIFEVVIADSELIKSGGAVGNFTGVCNDNDAFGGQIPVSVGDQ